MDILDEIRNSIDANKNFEEGIKTKLFELVLIFNDRYPDNLDRLNESIKTVQLGNIGIFYKEDTIVYDSKENAIELCTTKIKDAKNPEDEYDMDHLMMKGILAMITAQDGYYGFNKENKLPALNVGFTEMLACEIVGNNGISDYEEEYIATNLISKIVGEKILIDAYFGNNAELIYQKLLDAEGDSKLTETAMENLNYVYVSKKSGGVHQQTAYADACKMINGIFVNLMAKSDEPKEVIEEMINNYSDIIPKNSKMFTNENFNAGIEGIKPDFDNKINEMLNNKVNTNEHVKAA